MSLSQTPPFGTCPPSSLSRSGVQLVLSRGHVAEVPGLDEKPSSRRRPVRPTRSSLRCGDLARTRSSYNRAFDRFAQSPDRGGWLPFDDFRKYSFADANRAVNSSIETWRVRHLL